MTTSASPRTGLTVAGALVAALALAALIAGAALLAVDHGHRDADGFHTTGTRHITTSTRAVVSDRLDADLDGAGWLARDGRLGTLRLTATAAPGRRVFLGIAPAARVDAYLRGVARETVTDVDVDPFTLTTTRQRGTRTPPAPATRSFWTASASGAGRRTLTWDVEGGRWAAVLMNADAAPAVAADLSAGAKVPLLGWLAIGLLVAGVVGVLGGGAMLVAGTRRGARVRTGGAA
jgi:hypothetical protein